MSAMTQNFSTQVSGQNCPDQNMVTLHLKSMGSWVQITKTINKAHIIRPSHDDLMDLKGSNESLIMSYVGAHHICFHHMCSTQPDGVSHQGYDSESRPTRRCELLDGGKL